jgi:hypothetical protein
MEYRNATIGPLDVTSTKHRLNIKANPADVKLPHLRLVGTKIEDHSSVMFDADLVAAPENVIAGPCLYAGVYFFHFGHFVSECIHRLYARSVDERLRNAKVAFSVYPTQTVDPWFYPILDICGVSSDDVIFINSPHRFEHLIVPQQARILGGMTMIDGYSKVFPPLKSEMRDEARHSYYVSRSKHLYSGGFAGEMLLERQLEKAGFHILYPEEMPLGELIGKLSAADRIIFAEGSSIHNLELCRKTSAKIMVIGRRPHAAARFGYIVSEYSTAWHVFDDAFRLGSLEWDNAKNAMHGPRAVSVLDIRALLLSISNFFEISVELPAEEECQAAIMASLGQYILDPRTTRGKNTTDQQLGVLLGNLKKAYARYLGSRPIVLPA